MSYKYFFPVIAIVLLVVACSKGSTTPYDDGTGIPHVYTPGDTTAPVLDIYGEKDFPAVLGHAAKRADAIKHIRGSGQVSVAGADHYFNGTESELIRHVKRFLDNATR